MKKVLIAAAVVGGAIGLLLYKKRHHFIQSGESKNPDYIQCPVCGEMVYFPEGHGVCKGCKTELTLQA